MSEVFVKTCKGLGQSKLLEYSYYDFLVKYTFEGSLHEKTLINLTVTFSNNEKSIGKRRKMAWEMFSAFSSPFY